MSVSGPFVRPRLMLAMVTLVFVVNMLDRQIMGMLLPQIRAEFHLSDTALGLLAGPTFAIVYALMGVPLAMLADRINRRGDIRQKSRRWIAGPVIDDDQERAYLSGSIKCGVFFYRNIQALLNIGDGVSYRGERCPGSAGQITLKSIAKCNIAFRVNSIRKWIRIVDLIDAW